MAHLFLQGSSGMGKSSMLRKAFLYNKPDMSAIGGFCVQRLQKNGETVGFRAVDFKEDYPPLVRDFSKDLSGIFMYQRQWDMQPLVQLVKETSAHSYQCIILDEIGGIELVNDEFMLHLRLILSGKTSCVGVLKSTENMNRMRHHLKLGNEYLSLHQQLKHEIQNSGELITVTENNKQAVYHRLDEHIRKV